MNARKKMRLDPDLLRVDSFDTAAVEGEARGTVHGQALSMAYCTMPVDACSSKCDTGPTTYVR